MEIKKFEAYDINLDDFGVKEHSKKVISDYINNGIDGTTLQECFDDVIQDNDLFDASDDDGDIETIKNIKTSMVEYLQEMLEDAKNIMTD